MLMVAYITHKPGFTSTWERTLGLFSHAKIYAKCLTPGLPAGVGSGSIWPQFLFPCEHFSASIISINGMNSLLNLMQKDNWGIWNKCPLQKENFKRLNSLRWYHSGLASVADQTSLAVNVPCFLVFSFAQLFDSLSVGITWKLHLADTTPMIWYDYILSLYTTQKKLSWGAFSKVSTLAVSTESPCPIRN